jgi:hypothetical protein
MPINIGIQITHHKDENILIEEKQIKIAWKSDLLDTGIKAMIVITKEM